MRVSENWLREWVNPNLDTEALVEQLTIAGLEVDGVEPAAGEFAGVVVAEVVEVKPHPNADRLRVCRVNSGDSATAQVVCGAANARRGIKVPFAPVGAKLPGGLKIRSAKFRGVKSFGMLCSGQELGMTPSAEGLMELPADAAVGMAVRDCLRLDDNIIELNLTPNRGDCLGIMGVAREVAVLNDMSVTGPVFGAVRPTVDDVFAVTLDAPTDCPAYSGRVIRNINPAMPTPLWMRERLRRSGLRCIGPVVDITNYVLLELGQPMHAFDLAKLDGGIRVRRAKDAEKLTLLDGKAVELRNDVLIIADDKAALAMAGIMGGMGSAVDNKTTHLFLEAAYFNPLAISGRARRYGLHTDASHRFERGVDPGLQTRAIERATGLLIQVCGGEAGPLKRVQVSDALPRRRQIPLCANRVRHILGIDITTAQIEGYLQRLQAEYTGDGGKWRVKPPAYRFDLNIEADLIEEVARLYGYNNIPETLPVVPQRMVAGADNRFNPDCYKDVLIQRGWQEAITYSFVDPELQDLLGFDRQSAPLSNPMADEMSAMRTSHWAGLIKALQYNQRRQQKQVRLFEAGLNFIGPASGSDQQLWISGIAAGEYWPEQWSNRRRKIDFFDIKGDLEALFAHTRASGECAFKAETHPALHPGQTARIYRAGAAVGWIGVMHPGLEGKLSLEGPVVLFEVNGRALADARPGKFAPISKFPSIRRDLSVVVDEAVTAEAVVAVINGIGLNAIDKVCIFDAYKGKDIECGRKSMSLGLILLDSLSTLTDEDVGKIVSQVLDRLAKELDARLRN